MKDLTLDDIAYRVAKYGRITRDEPRQDELDAIKAHISRLNGRDGREPEAFAWAILRNGKRCTIYSRELAAKLKEIWPDSDVIELCPRSPDGWVCTRKYRHKGLCALWKNEPSGEQ